MFCSAINCSNRNTQGFRLFRFPADPQRRKIWVLNSRRSNWTPTDSARLCSVHFDDNQFERNLIDGLIKLKWNAIPTIFNVPNPINKILTTRRSACMCNYCLKNLHKDSLTKHETNLFKIDNDEEEVPAKKFLAEQQLEVLTKKNVWITVKQEK